MYPDFLIHDEIKRREQETWEPIPLHLPLPLPFWPEDKKSEGDSDEREEGRNRGVVIIDMNDYSEVLDL